jgi:hypothetical protein
MWSQIPTGDRKSSQWKILRFFPSNRFQPFYFLRKLLDNFELNPETWILAWQLIDSRDLCPVLANCFIRVIIRLKSRIFLPVNFSPFVNFSVDPILEYHHPHKNFIK